MRNCNIESITHNALIQCLAALKESKKHTTQGLEVFIHKIEFEIPLDVFIDGETSSFYCYPSDSQQDGKMRFSVDLKAIALHYADEIK